MYNKHTVKYSSSQHLYLSTAVVILTASERIKDALKKLCIEMHHEKRDTNYVRTV